MANDSIFNAQYGQNQFDICMNTYGSLESLVKLLNDNNIDLTEFNPQQAYAYDSTLIADTNIFLATTNKGYFYSTGISPDVLLSETGEWLYSEDGNPLLAE